MTEPYSLAVEPWLPVATKNGKRIFIRIRDVGREDLLRIDTGRADCDISLTEFLIGLLSVSMGPSGIRDWVKRYETPPSPDEIDAAIKPFAHALVLDGDGPRFFQDCESLKGEEVPVSSLLMEMPGAQTLKDNADHFVKRGGASLLSRKGAAIALLTLQTNAPSGGAGHRTSLRGGGPATTLIIPRREDAGPVPHRNRAQRDKGRGLGHGSSPADEHEPTTEGFRLAEAIGELLKEERGVGYLDQSLEVEHAEGCGRHITRPL